MSGALVKWNNPVKHSDNAKVEKALAKLRDIRPSTCELVCVCAVHDRPYVLRFRRSPNGKFKYVEAEKLTGAACGTAKSTVMSMADFDLGPTACPWCGDKGFAHCAGYCNAFVCCGRMTGNTFRCRDSCRAVWQGTPMKEIEVSTATKGPGHMQRASRPMQPKPGVKMIEASANAGRFDFLK